MMKHFDAVVIGAGLSGLVAAGALHQAGKNVLVLEASAQVGGLIQTYSENGFTFEAGPHTFPSTAVEINDLCEQLELIPKSAQSAHNRYIYLNQQLTPLPGKPWQFFSTPVLSMAGKCRVLLEPLQSKIQAKDISIAEFFTHRLGPELTQNLVDPFISGVYAGDIHQLSLPAVFPKLWEWEQSEGSLLKGAIAQKKENKNAAPRKKMELLSFDSGLTTLIQALANSLPSESILTQSPVLQIQKNEIGYVVILESGQMVETTQLVLSVPAFVAAKLLQTVNPRVSELLNKIRHASLTVVHSGFKKDAISHALDGFGFLVPQKEKLPLLGTIWASSLFPERAPKDHVLLSSFIGGVHHPEVNQMSSEAIEQLALKNLATVFKIDSDLRPVFTKSLCFERAIPQYNLGHLKRMDAIQTELKACSRLALCGNYLDGISLNHCVQSGLNAVKQVLREV